MLISLTWSDIQTIQGEIPLHITLYCQKSDGAFNIPSCRGAHMAVGLQQLWDPARTSSNPSLLLTSICNSFSTAWKKHISISQVYDQKQVSLHVSKRRECSQTVHYLGFLDMAAQTTWPHSSLEKKKSKNKVWRRQLFRLISAGISFFLICGDRFWVCLLCYGCD